MGSKCAFLKSLTTPPEPPTRHVARGPVLGHPSNGGELIPRQDEGQVPLCGGVARSAGVVYSMAHACSNSYMPVVSVYDTPAGAYIMHDPPAFQAATTRAISVMNKIAPIPRVLINYKTRGTFILYCTTSRVRRHFSAPRTSAISSAVNLKIVAHGVIV